MKTYCLFLISFITLVSCGPSQELFATQTSSSATDLAASWTSTPTITPTITPSPTPTPIPFDLLVLVHNEANEPIAGASVLVAELVKPDYVAEISDDFGAVSLFNLPGDIATLRIFSQGYSLKNETLILERGLNEFSIGLAQDPYGLIPEDYLAEGETLLFIEDFQDEDEDFVELLGDWHVKEDPTLPGNWIIEVSPGPVGAEYSYSTVTFGPENLNDFIVTFRFKYIGLDYGDDANWLSLDFRNSYSVSIPPYWRTFQIIDRIDDEWVFPMQVPFNYRSDVWYLVRVEVIGSTGHFYLNGSLMGRLRDLRLPETTSRFGFSVGTGSVVQFDDIVVIAPSE